MIELSKELLSGVSPPISVMLASFVQNPQFSLDPYYWVVLIGGSVTFVISLGRFLEKKHSWVRGIWHVAGIGLAGLVLVSWARYESFLTGIMIEAVVIAAIVIGFFLTRRALAEKYGKNTRLVYLGLALGALLPLAAVLPQFSATPVLKISPYWSWVYTPHGGIMETMNVTIGSFYGNVWDIQVTAESPDEVAVYLGGIKDGPVVIPFLERGRKYVGTIRLETSPQIRNGTYNVLLRYQYRDATGHIYHGSENISVQVGGPPSEPIPPSYLPSLLSSLLLGLMIILGLGLVIQRIVRRRKKPPAD